MFDFAVTLLERFLNISAVDIILDKLERAKTFFVPLAYFSWNSLDMYVPWGTIVGAMALIWPTNSMLLLFVSFAFIYFFA